MCVCLLPVSWFRWVDRRNWVDDLAMTLWNQDAGQDELIGQTKISLLEAMAWPGHPEDVKEKLVEIFNGACVHVYPLLPFFFDEKLSL